MPVPDIRLDWETYVPEVREDRLLELLLFYGPPFPRRDEAGNELVCPGTSESHSSSLSPISSDGSESSSGAAAPSVSAGGGERARLAT